jgi:mannose/fructose/N-acetylgalactosamine-specific phosphotransferase system component IIB
MTVLLTRIDQKLIHGQILSAWVPFLDINKIAVVDINTYNNAKAREILSSAVSKKVDVVFLGPRVLVDFMESFTNPKVNCLILFQNVSEARLALLGLTDNKINSLNLGYCAPMPDANCLKIAKFFSILEDELADLTFMHENGINLFAQSVPEDKKTVIIPTKYVWKH